MQHLIATDEAGYGPNLGPLVIGTTRWKTASKNCDLSKSLSGFVFNKKSDFNQFERNGLTSGLMIADSKLVYSSGKLELLERGVLSGLYAIHGNVPESVPQLLEMLSVSRQSIQDSEYFGNFDTLLPLCSEADLIKKLGMKISETLAKHSASLSELSVATVFPRKFNQQIKTLGNKANCLTAETLRLIKSQLGRAKPKADDFVKIECDKLGGRNQYAAAMKDLLSDPNIETIHESRSYSQYSFRDGSGSIRFTAKGESFMPIALASMCAKYIREIFMMRWNRYWQHHLPNLKPTKGYPVDAKRFKRDIAAVQKRIGVADEDIWRVR